MTVLPVRGGGRDLFAQREVLLVAPLCLDRRQPLKTLLDFGVRRRAASATGTLVRASGCPRPGSSETASRSFICSPSDIVVAFPQPFRRGEERGLMLWDAARKDKKIKRG